MSSKFDIDLGSGPAKKTPKSAKPGPMSAAIRETAASLDRTEEEVKNRRKKNAEDAKKWREALENGLVNLRLPVSAIVDDDLTRDRLNSDAELSSEEMEELKTSISQRGQLEPISVFQRDGKYVLIAGWRRLNALKQLYSETGDKNFGVVTVQVQTDEEDRVEHYTSMVTENVVRKNLSLAEMAGVALAVVNDQDAEIVDTRTAVSRLYAFSSAQQRSYINSFVELLSHFGDVLVDPRTISRDLGLKVVRSLPLGDASGLSSALRSTGSAEEQLEVLSAFAEGVNRPKDKRGSRQGVAVKTEFRVGSSKITARNGEFRIKSDVDYSGVPRERLEEALQAFERVLKR